ncbi:MAG TPA: MmcQ/YjbR family DNA-binding protein [Spirochaetota bacterium]|nr:MmcQ/YjbR family DNA-binding protein [Spirochaetota bacterium]HPS85331.1 MmcQ/YjbR family DNA-binding protein [Spirochaetota bacterium]
MKLEDLRKYCSSKKGVQEDFPFDLNILTFKVCGKIFALTDISREELTVNLKCMPEHALLLRTVYSQVTPGYHMNKKHWNTVLIDGEIPDSEIYLMIDQSYELVLAGVKKSLKDMLQ